MAKRILTLNIGTANIELAEYAVGAKGALTLVNVGAAPLSVPLDEENAATVLSPAILEIVRERGIRPGPVAVSVSGQMVFQRFAALPMAGGEEKFEQLVRYEIEQNIPLPIDEMICDRQVLGDTENGDKSVMIVAAKSDQIESLSSAISSVGFTPTIVEASPIAVTNAVRYNRPENENDAIVILDIGAKTTSLVIAEGDRFYSRSIPVAGNVISKEISQALGCPQEDAEQYKLERAYVSLGGVNEDEDEATDRISKVCRAVLTRLNAEISRSINFYRSQQGGSAPVKLFITGGTAVLPQIDQFFAESLGIEVELFNPFERINLGSKVDADALETQVAILSSTVGLALQEAAQSHFVINLLPLSLIEAKAERAKIPFLVAAGVMLALSLVLVMLGLNRETEVLVARRDAVQQFSGTLDKWEKKVDAAKKEFDGVDASCAEVRKLMLSRSAAVQRLNAVRSSLAPGMWIDRWEGGKCTIRYWASSVKGSGSKTPGELVVDKIKGKPVVVPESVKISAMSTIGKNGEIEQFTVELAFK